MKNYDDDDYRSYNNDEYDSYSEHDYGNYDNSGYGQFNEQIPQLTDRQKKFASNAFGCIGALFTAPFLTIEEYFYRMVIHTASPRFLASTIFFFSR